MEIIEVIVYGQNPSIEKHPCHVPNESRRKITKPRKIHHIKFQEPTRSQLKYWGKIFFEEHT